MICHWNWTRTLPLSPPPMRLSAVCDYFGTIEIVGENMCKGKENDDYDAEEMFAWKMTWAKPPHSPVKDTWSRSEGRELCSSLCLSKPCGFLRSFYGSWRTNLREKLYGQWPYLEQWNRYWMAPQAHILQKSKTMWSPKVSDRLCNLSKTTVFYHKFKVISEDRWQLKRYSWMAIAIPRLARPWGNKSQKAYVYMVHINSRSK